MVRVFSHIAALTDGIFVARHARAVFRSWVWTLVPLGGDRAKFQGRGRVVEGLDGGTKRRRERQRSKGKGGRKGALVGWIRRTYPTRMGTRCSQDAQNIRVGRKGRVSLSPSIYRSIPVPFRHFSHFHTPRGEAEEQSSMAGREPAYYAAKRYHGAQSSAIKPPSSMDLPEHRSLLLSTLFSSFLSGYGDDNKQIKFESSNNYSWLI